VKRTWLVPFGTRPEVVKLAPVVTAMRAHGLQVTTIATGQHDDPRLTDVFFDDLSLEPDTRWELPRPEPERVGAMLTQAYRALGSGAHDAVLMLGDTHTVPLFALAARRFGVPIVHVEAGLRSFNARSTEEGSRRVASALATLHLAPTQLAARALEAEGIAAERVFVVGNPVTDSLRRWGPRRREPAERSGAVVTLHRATNVDDPERLRELVGLVRRLGADLDWVRFPVHPRTRDRLARFGIDDLRRAPGVVVEPPLRYREMLAAVAAARVVLTDSGGLQEEAAWFGVPAVVLRATTPRWEGVVAGSAVLAGTDVERARDAVLEFATDDAQARVAALPCPYGDGHVGDRIASLLCRPDVDTLLDVSDPPLALGPFDFVGFGR
jgi:UDP-N-acetylglucosamine 2-epimerase (non-hydrolysing)